MKPHQVTTNNISGSKTHKTLSSCLHWRFNSRRPGSQLLVSACRYLARKLRPVCESLNYANRTVQSSKNIRSPFQADDCVCVNLLARWAISRSAARAPKYDSPQSRALSRSIIRAEHTRQAHGQSSGNKFVCERYQSASRKHSAVQHVSQPSVREVGTDGFVTGVCSTSPAFWHKEQLSGATIVFCCTLAGQAKVHSQAFV